jgi:hypothetical protein
VHELLDAVQDGLTLLRVQLTLLFAKEAVDVGVALRVGPPGRHEGPSRVAALPKAPLAPWMSPLYFFSAQPLKKAARSRGQSLALKFL